MTTVDDMVCSRSENSLPPARSNRDRSGAGGCPGWRLERSGPLWGLLLLVSLIYWPTVVALVRIWAIDPNYSHGFVVPVLSLVFAWWAARQQGGSGREQVGRSETARGLLEVLLGLGLHFGAFLVGALFLDVVALICILRGTLLAVGGREANRIFGFAAFFLVFMAPLPIGWYQPVARILQQVVSAGAACLLELGGAAVYREGYLLHLPGYTLEVGEACSGIRQLTTVLALAVTIGYFASERRWYRWTLAAVAIPVAVVANGLRVVLSGGVLLWFGRRWAEGVFHTLEGLAMTGLAAVLLLGVAYGLSQWQKKLEIRSTKSEAHSHVT